MVPSAIARSICPDASTASVERVRLLAHGGRQLAQDPLRLLALRARGLRLPVAQLGDLERLDEERLARIGGVVDDARHAAARAHLDGEHRPAAALRDEVLLEVLADAALAHELLEPVGDALTAGAELAAQLPQLRRGVVLEVGAVLLDRAVDRLGERLQRRVDRGGELAEERRLLLRERRSSAQRACDGVADVPQRRGGQDAAERSVRGSVANVANPFERRLRRDVEQRDRLGSERLAPRDFPRVRRRRQRAGQRGSRVGGSRGGDPLPDRGELERVESLRFHRPSVGRIWSSAMRSRRQITVVGCHAGGEVGNVVVGGVLPPPGATVFEQMQALQRDGDGLRRLLLREPRGSVAVHANLVVPATRADCDAGFIIMEPTEYPGHVRLEHDLHGDCPARDGDDRDARARDRPPPRGARGRRRGARELP